MGEYIEREAARPDEFCVGVSCQECPFLKDPLYGGCRVDDFIMALPPADVRSVVLCKDCDLWNEWDSSGRESLGTYRCSCAEWTTEITTYYTGPDEFCSRGVRRDSDG
jgi:hypothetical protein